MSAHVCCTARGGLTADLRRVAALAAPMLAGQLAFIAFGVLDTVMVSHYSAIELAALSLGASVNIAVYMGLATILYALQPIVGRLYGDANYARIGVQVREAAWLALALMTIGWFVLRHPDFVLRIAHASPPVSTRAKAYLHVLSLAFPASIGFGLFMSLSNAVSRPQYALMIWLSALVLKIPLNAWLIFGGFGLHGLGGTGAAAASATVLWFGVLACIALLKWHPFYRRFGVFTQLSRPDWRAQFALLRLGVPMALASLIEVTSYTFMTLFIARFSATVLAGHQIAVNLGAVLYMTPLAIGIASSSLVSQELGAGSPAGARSVARAGILLAAGCAVLVTSVVMTARHAIVDAYTHNPDVAAIALPLVQIVAIYHLADALQVSAAYALRGYQVTVVPTLVYAFALYGVGLGGGYLTAFDVLRVVPVALSGAPGFWWASTASLTLAAACLLFFLGRASRAALDAPSASPRA
ncbi:MATE family efflux transporter [Paraburkholderia jirisanensis]